MKTDLEVQEQILLIYQYFYEYLQHRLSLMALKKIGIKISKLLTCYGKDKNNCRFELKALLWLIVIGN